MQHVKGLWLHYKLQSDNQYIPHPLDQILKEKLICDIENNQAEHVVHLMETCFACVFQ